MRALYVRVKDIPAVNKVLEHFGYDKVTKDEDRWVMSILNRRNVKGYTVQQAVIEVLEEARKTKK